MPTQQPVFNPKMPFTRTEAIAAGVAKEVLRDKGAYQRLFRTIWVSSSTTPSLQIRALGALRVAGPGSVLTHHTAAELWGGIVPSSPDIHVSVGEKRRLRIDGVAPHRRAQHPAFVRQRGLPVTSPERTFLDLASQLHLVDLVVLGDALVKKKVTTPEKLVHGADEFRGRSAVLARRATRLVREGVDSPMESRLRMLIVLSGLPEPVVNHKITDHEGRVRYRMDLSYPSVRMAIEFDGRHHIQRQEQWSEDLLRREDLENDRWRFVVCVAAGIYENPAETLARIVEVRRTCGLHSPALRSEWRRYFPGRLGA